MLRPEPGGGPCARCTAVPIEEIVVSIVAPEDLILSKLIWMEESRSAVQRRDIEGLLRSVPNLDQAYLERVAFLLWGDLDESLLIRVIGDLRGWRIPWAVIADRSR